MVKVGADEARPPVAPDHGVGLLVGVPNSYVTQSQSPVPCPTPDESKINCKNTRHPLILMVMTCVINTDLQHPEKDIAVHRDKRIVPRSWLHPEQVLQDDQQTSI